MMNQRRLALLFLAAGFVGLGVLTMIYGDFAMEWQPVSSWVPGRTALAYGSGIILMFGGIGLVPEMTRSASATILFPYLFIWLMLKVPALFVAPGIEGVWLGFGEVAALFAAGWVLFAQTPIREKGWSFRYIKGDRGVQIARILFGLSLIPIGLSHLMYPKETVSLIPAWIPFPFFWAYLTGLGQMLCGFGVVLRIYPRIAAAAEAMMVGLFTLIVWGAAIVEAPKARLSWTAFFFSWTFAASAWILAGSMNTSVNRLRES
jgi:uncharacterized membrane protein